MPRMTDDERAYEGGKRIAADLANAVDLGKVNMIELYFGIALFTASVLTARMPTIEEAKSVLPQFRDLIEHEIDEMWKLRAGQKN